LRVKPVLRWPGGKHRHLKFILPLIPKHHCYCEPFAGGLAVFLAKEKSPLEVVNDQNNILVALYRNAKYHVEELIAEVHWILNARSNMEDFRTEQGLTEIQRVARWLVRNKLSYGGMGRHFGYEGARASRERVVNALRELSARFDRTIIENLPYQDCIRHYDKPDTFFFLDPPYLGADPGIYEGWNEEQMRTFAALVREIRGLWLVTVNDSPVTREIFSGFRLRTSALDNKLASARLKTKVIMRELLITPRATARSRRRASLAAGSRPAGPSGGTSRLRRATIRTPADR
jgi:DNA adenine methylase